MNAESMYVPDDVRKEFLAKKNVVGVGIGYKTIHGKKTDTPSVVTMVRKKEALFNIPPDDRIPRFAKGLIQTDVLEVGNIKALSYTNKERPAPGGVSIGHYRITAGTFGTLVRDANTGQVLILSNNHVLANSNDASLGDPILQPGPIDGGQPGKDTIGTLLRFVPIDFNLEGGTCPWAELYAKFGNAVAQLFNSQHRVKTYSFRPQAVNHVDAAVATPYRNTDVKPDILNIGVVNGVVPAFLGQEVRKTGRTTEYTEGTIELIDATVQVQYGEGKIATFEKQLISGYMSKGGDSGSLLVEKNSLRAVGLLYAGSDQVTIYNPIAYVLDALEITI